MVDADYCYCSTSTWYCSTTGPTLGSDFSAKEKIGSSQNVSSMVTIRACVLCGVFLQPSLFAKQIKTLFMCVKQITMAPSGIKKAWRLWRHCCCRYGIFPLLVVPITTMGCAMTLYSSTGCKFVEIDIGFEPSNEDWNATSPYQFGVLYYHDAAFGHDNTYQEKFHTGCVEFSDAFYDNFVQGDQTFKMTQSMTMISCGASALAMVRH